LKSWSSLCISKITPKAAARAANRHDSQRARFRRWRPCFGSGAWRCQKKIAATVGLKKVRTLHLNDSKKPLGCRVDNHAPIGKGHIGLKPFSFWINDKTWAKTLAVLETPGGEKNYQRELKLLRKL
jgi:hypothetical protein